MIRPSSNDLDYLATRLHARRSRMAEQEHLDELCRVRSFPELGHAIFPGANFAGTEDFQRRLVQNLIAELSACLKHLDGEDQDFICWLLARFQVENVKILLRGFLNRIPLEELQPRLAQLPSDLVLDAAVLLTAKSLEELVGRLPTGNPRNQLQSVLDNRHEPPACFILESALDAGYFQELWVRTNQLSGGEQEIIKPLISQEVNMFQFLLAARGKFHFGLTTETLLSLRVPRTKGEWLDAMLSAPDVASTVKCVIGIVIDVAPASRHSSGEPSATDLAAIEVLAWQRYLRLANSAFRRSHNGIAAVAGYFGVRRMEITNLITLSEGIRLGVNERTIRARMIPQTNLEVAHV